MKTNKIQSIRTITIASIGTVLEWYDFTLFAFLTPLLAKNFFPDNVKTTGLILMYGIFAASYFVRPLGAALIGHLGDRIGRKKTLLISIVLMAGPTFLIGLLPTYHQIGIYAPLLLMCLRLLQGLSAGGEFTGAVLFVLESTQSRFRGVLSGIIGAVMCIGGILGSLAASLAILYSHYAWSWRVPFLFGLLTGIIGYFVRRRTTETALFRSAAATATLVNYPLYQGIKYFPVIMLRLIGLYTLSTVNTYLLFIFMASYAGNIIGLPLGQVTWLSTAALFIFTILLPLSGYLSDIFGRKKCLQFAAVSIFILSYPLFILITTKALTNFIIAETILLLLAVLFEGSVMVSAFEQVPTAIRFSIIAVCYNLTSAIFGGTLPLVMHSIVQLTNNKAAPGLYLMFTAGLAVLATVKMRETYRNKMSAVADSNFNNKLLVDM